MEAKELRIGNLVQCEFPLRIPRLQWYEDNYMSVTAYGLQEFSDGNIDFNPIKLTEEWLEKLGLINKNDIKNSDFKYGKYIATYNFGGISINYETNGNQYSFNNEIKYVHQLQNLYFALTGEELTIQE